MHAPPATPSPLATWPRDERGMSLMFVVLGMLLLALLGSVMVSIVTSERYVGVNQTQSMAAQYAAESGLERALRYFFDEDNACVDDPTVFDVSMSNGGYVVNTDLFAPAALLLDAGVDEVATSFVVDGDTTAAGYAPYGIVVIDQEMMECSVVTSGAQSTFAGCKRGVGGTTPALHGAGNKVLQEFCVITSTGSMPAAPTGTAQRVVSMGFSQFDLGWAVGDEGTIIQWNGLEWLLVADPDKPTGRNLRAVRLTSLTRGLATGDWGVAVQVDGAVWTKDRSASIYLVANNGNEIDRFDTDPLEVGRSTRFGTPISVPGGGGATEVVTTQNGKYLYVTRNGLDDVVVIDADTGALVNTIDLFAALGGVPAGPRGLAISPDGLRVYVVNETDKSISVICRAGPFPCGTEETNPSNDFVEQTITPLSDLGAEPHYIGLSIDGTRAFVTTTQTTGKLEVITGLPAAPVVGPAGIELCLDGCPGIRETDQWSIAMHPYGGYAHISGKATNRVYQIDTANLTATDSIVLFPGDTETPSGLTYTSTGDEIYVTKPGANKVLAIDWPDNSAAPGGDVVVEGGPTGVVTSADSSEIYTVIPSLGRVNVVHVADHQPGTGADIVTPTGGIAAAPARSVRSLSMINPTEGWAVGDDGRILHWDGNAWLTQPMVDFETPTLPPNTVDNGNGTWTTTIQPAASDGFDSYTREGDDVGCFGAIGCTDDVKYNDPAVLDPEGDPEVERLGLRRVMSAATVGFDGVYRSYLQFDLGDIKDYALSVKEASLQLYAHEVDLRPEDNTEISGDQLQLYYPYDVDNNPYVPNAAGALNTGYHYSAPGGAVYTGGLTGDALVFDDARYDRVIVAALNPALQGAQKISVVTSVNFSNPAHLVGVNRELIRKGISNNSLSYMLWVEDGYPAFSVRLSNGLRYDAVSTDTRLQANQWYELAGTYDGTVARVFEGGNLKAEVSAPGVLYKTSSPPLSILFCGGWTAPSTSICIGGTNQNGNIINKWRGNDFDGLLEDTLIYDRALSSEELKEKHGWGTRTIDVRRVKALWDDDTITGSNQPLLEPGVAASTDVSAENVPEVPVFPQDPSQPNQGKWVYWTVTSLVDGWVKDVYPNRGLALEVDETEMEHPLGIMWFHSADTDPDNLDLPAHDHRPRLVVTYRVSASQNLNAVAVLDQNSNGVAEEGWAVGAGGVILHYVDADDTDATVGTWVVWSAADNAPELRPTEDLKSIAMVDNTDGWIVGDSGAMYQFNGDGHWEKVAGPTSENLQAVSITPDGQGLAVGANGVVLSYDGTAWSDETGAAGVTERLLAIKAFSDAKGWGAGEDGVIVRKLGGTWQAQGDAGTVTPTNKQLNSIDILPAQTTLSEWRENY